MKVHLSQIDEAGWHGALSMEGVELARLGEALGPQGGRLEAEITLKQRGGNVEVRGGLRGTLQVPCQRCLEPVPVALDEPLWVTLAPDPAEGELQEDLHLSAGDLEVSFFSGEEVDLIRVVEDEIFLLLPEPVCGEDAQGRCLQCGKDVEEMFKNREGGQEGHPFAKMKDLLT